MFLPSYYNITGSAQTLPLLGKRSDGDISAVRKVYNKTYSILEEANFLSKKQNCMSMYTVIDTPIMSDVLGMLEPLQVRKFLLLLDYFTLCIFLYFRTVSVKECII